MPPTPPGVDVDDVLDSEHEAPVDTPAERAYSIRAAVAGVRSTRRFARISLAVAAVALLVAARHGGAGAHRRDRRRR